MKKLISMALAFSALTLLVPPSMEAATVTQGPISVSATVETALSLGVVMRRNDFAGAVVTNMDFGTLVDIGTGTLRSSPTSTTGTGAVDVFLTPNSQGAPYTITQTGTALSNGTTTLPSGALTVVPVYAAADNGGATQPAGSSLGTAGTWVTGSKLIYASESGTAASRTVQAIYSVTDDPAAGATTGVPISQAGGTYTGTVTFTMTTI